MRSNEKKKNESCIQIQTKQNKTKRSKCDNNISMMMETLAIYNIVGLLHKTKYSRHFFFFDVDHSNLLTEYRNDFYTNMHLAYHIAEIQRNLC